MTSATFRTREPNGFDAAVTHKDPPRQAFTLLEIILALAILAGAVALLGEAMQLASRAAADCRGESHAKMLAESIMAELLSGMADLTDIDREPIDSDDTVPWVYSVIFSEVDTDLEGLTAVEVLVEQDLDKAFRPVKYRLVQWLWIDPNESSSDDTSTDDSTSSTSGGGNG